MSMMYRRHGAKFPLAQGLFGVGDPPRRRKAGPRRTGRYPCSRRSPIV